MFNQLVQNHYAPLCKIAMGRRGQYMSIDEAKQVVLIELWKYSLNPQQVRNLGAFLNVIIQRRMQNARREDKYYYSRYSTFPTEDFWSTEDGQALEGDYIAAQDLDNMWREVGEHVPCLPDAIREVISLRLSGLQYKDISNYTGSPIGTIGMRVAQGKELLTENLCPKS